MSSVGLYHAKGNGDWSWGAGQRYLSAKLARNEGDVYGSFHVARWSNLDRGSNVLYVTEHQPTEGDLVTVDATAIGGDITRTGRSADLWHLLRYRQVGH